MSHCTCASEDESPVVARRSSRQRRTVAGGGSWPQTFHPHATAAAGLVVQTISDDGGETTDKWLPEV